MTPERFQQIEELFHAAREANAETRAALLTNADPQLRREAELLLAQQNSGDFLDRPAIENAPELLEDGTVTQLAAGSFLGPYRLENKLGEGGMGEVFRAVDTRLGRAVAIKFVHERFSARFEREARAISSLNHPQICTLYDIGPNYLVMELLAGDTLAARLKDGPLAADQALRYASQILAALAEAHEHGIVHRDLKPGNIMIVKSGIKVLDFGLATWDGDDTLTGSHVVMGTPAYMAPEQRAGKPSDSRTDLYAFGGVFYEMLTGNRAASPDRKPIQPKSLATIVNRCLEVDPARRWQSAAALGRVLEDLQTAPNKTQTWRVAAMAAALIGVLLGAYFLFRPVPKLTARDVVVLADFVNQTGDPIFDGTLRQGLAGQLEQSPFLKIMDDEEVQRVLRLMGLPPGARVTNPIAHEICIREGAAAIIDGTIASLGKNYVMTLQAVACQGGATVAREQIQVPDKDHVLSALGTAATSMRAKLGESRNSVQKWNRSPEPATTPSLAALQSYTAGYDELLQGHSLLAIPFLQRAVELDPKLAMGYNALGVAFEVAGEAAKSREYAKKAYALIDQVSDFERDHIAAYYFNLGVGELDKAISVYESGIRSFPRNWNFHNSLGMTYIDLGRFEEGLDEGLKSSRLQPNAEPAYRRQLDAYICTDRLAEASQLAAKLREQGLDRTRIHQRFLELAYVEDDPAAINREIQWFATKSEEYLSFGLQAAYLNIHGRRRESHALYQRAAETALRQGLRNAAADFESADARADALAGNCQTARRIGRPALALALCGDTAQVERLIVETAKIYPNGTLWNAVELPALRAALSLHDNQPARSVVLLTSAQPYERAYPETMYLRGMAYLKLHDGAKAVGEFQKITDHKGASWATDWRRPYWGQFYTLSYLGLARGHAINADGSAARKAYQDFFAFWKDADPGIPILRQAKIEYAKLH